MTEKYQRPYRHSWNIILLKSVNNNLPMKTPESFIIIFFLCTMPFLEISQWILLWIIITIKLQNIPLSYLVFFFFFTIRDSRRNINFSRSFKESEAEVGIEWKLSNLNHLINITMGLQRVWQRTLKCQKKIIIEKRSIPKGGQRKQLRNFDLWSLRICLSLCLPLASQLLHISK